MEDPIQAARERFRQGYSCSQSVFCAFAKNLGLTDEVALKLASPFGGGLAHRGQVCGAVTGALLALGLGCGSASLDDKDETYRLAGDFIRSFEDRHGTILCRELIGHDISTPGGLQKAREDQVFKAICPVLVADAAEIVAGFLV